MKRWVLLVVGLVVVFGMSIRLGASVTCDVNSIKDYAISQGFNNESLTIGDNDNIKLFNQDFFFAKIFDDEDNRETYYVRCDTGEIYDHRPSFEELFGETKISSDLWEKMQESDANEFDIIVFKSTSSPINTQAVIELISVGMVVIDVRELGEKSLITGTASREEIDKISNIEWVEEVGANIKLHPSSMSTNGSSQYSFLYGVIWVLITIIIILVVISIYLLKTSKRGTG